VCFGKRREDALQHASPSNPHFGIGDTLVRINGTLMSSNCDLPGFSHPNAIVCKGVLSEITPLTQGEQLEGENILANSPLLVMDGEFAIPEFDWGLNRWAHSSNAAFGLIGKPGAMQTSVFVVSDGHDGCSRKVIEKPLKSLLFFRCVVESTMRHGREAHGLLHASHWCRTGS
jgi:hypothetical protein